MYVSTHMQMQICMFTSYCGQWWEESAVQQHQSANVLPDAQGSPPKGTGPARSKPQGLRFAKILPK